MIIDMIYEIVLLILYGISILITIVSRNFIEKVSPGKETTWMKIDFMRHLQEKEERKNWKRDNLGENWEKLLLIFQWWNAMDSEVFIKFICKVFFFFFESHLQS